MLSAQIQRWQASLLLFNHSENLRFSETAFPNLVYSLRLGRRFISVKELSGGRSIIVSDASRHALDGTTDCRAATGIKGKDLLNVRIVFPSQIGGSDCY